MKLKGLIFLLLVAVGSSVFAQKRSLTELADEAFEAKQYVTAIDLYKKAYTKVKANRQEMYIWTEQNSRQQSWEKPNRLHEAEVPDGSWHKQCSTYLIW